MEGGEDCEYIRWGGVATIISQEEKKHTFMYRKMKKECVGSVRAPLGQDTVEAMKHCKEYTITYGGHPQASGFRVENKNLARFKNCLLEYFNNLSA